MKYTTAITALVGAVATMPLDSTECRAYPAGNALTPSPNTLDSFMNSELYTAEVKTPAGYETVVVNSNSTVEDNAHYITYVPIPSNNSNGYDPAFCANICNQDATCKSFNTYYQRNPSLVPSNFCLNPDAIIHSRCALYSTSLSADQVTNNGQNRGPMLFEVRMRGSNVYNKLLSPSQLNYTLTRTVWETATSVVSMLGCSTVTVTASAHSIPATTVTTTVTMTATVL